MKMNLNWCGYKLYAWEPFKKNIPGSRHCCPANTVMNLNFPTNVWPNPFETASRNRKLQQVSVIETGLEMTVDSFRKTKRVFINNTGTFEGTKRAVL